MENKESLKNDTSGSLEEKLQTIKIRIQAIQEIISLQDETIDILRRYPNSIEIVYHIQLNK